MRNVSAKQFLKILKGEDLEFRISPFSFRMTRPLCINEIHLPYDINFNGCVLSDIVFKNCRFSGHIDISGSNIKSLCFEECQLHNLNLLSSSIGNFELKKSSELKELIIKNSDINRMVVEDNPIYESIHIGCENNVRDCFIIKNGEPKLNSFSTKVFICPEKFENITLSDLTTEALHIGTFGEYAKFTIKDVKAEVVLIDGCSAELSKVNIENVRPQDSSVSALHFINTAFDQDVFGESSFKNYKVTKIHHQNVDASSLIHG